MPSIQFKLLLISQKRYFTFFVNTKILEPKFVSDFEEQQNKHFNTIFIGQNKMNKILKKCTG